MIQFKVSAPCCLSLFGEHAVKCDRKGLIAAIDSRTTLTFKELLPSEDSSLHLNFHGNKLVQESLEKFLKFYSDCKENMMKENMTSFREQVLQFAGDSYKSDNHKMIVQAFYYLLVLMALKEKIEIKSFSMDLSTELTVDGELACPESFTVCLAASLLRWSCLQKSTHDTCNRNEFNLRKVQLYATCCQEIYSEFEMINVRACLFGSLIKYNPRDPYLAILPGMPNMSILIVDSKQMQNLEALSQQMIEVKNNLPEIEDSILNIFDKITSKAYDIFQELFQQLNNYEDSKVIKTRRTKLYDELKSCILLSQNLLHAFNASHDSLNNICAIARKHEMYGKYTNIGNGRCAYIWCPQHTHVDEPCKHVELISKELKTHGFDVTETNLARDGMIIESN